MYCHTNSAHKFLIELLSMCGRKEFFLFLFLSSLEGVELLLRNSFAISLRKILDIHGNDIYVYVIAFLPMYL